MSAGEVHAGLEGIDRASGGVGVSVASICTLSLVTADQRSTENETDRSRRDRRHIAPVKQAITSAVRA